MKGRLLIHLAVVIMGRGLYCVGQTNSSWPHIRDFDRKYSFGNQEDMFLQFPILTLGGNTAYRVECANPFVKDPRFRSFDWSGDFECRVAKPEARSLPDVQLLAESTHVTAEWESRGRFWWNELTPDCIDFPDWGGTRVYRFRHMQITIRITNPNIVPPTPDSRKSHFHILRGLEVEVSGRYDEAAKRPVAGLTNIYEPPNFDLNDVDSPRQCGSRLQK